MRLLVCGGRSFNNHTFVFKTLDAFPEISVIITGAAAGVDTLALAWARENEIPFIGVPAQWKNFRRSRTGAQRGDAYRLET